MKLLFLAHRIPYPPNKGDKIRSFHELRALVMGGHEVHLLAFADDARDLRYERELSGLCASVGIIPLNAAMGKLRALKGLIGSAPLSLGYFASNRMRRAVARGLDEVQPDAVFVYSSTMAQYVPPEFAGRTVVDLVDVDSEKWRDYATRKSPLTSWLYRTEWRRLRRYEHEIVKGFAHTVLTTEREAGLLELDEFTRRARLHTITNGVDLEFYHSPAAPSQVPDNERPFLADSAVVRLVFTGAMDYYANAEGARYFVEEVFPLIRARVPQAEFLIVGSNPTAEVRQLGTRDGVQVTGFVEDVRPYLAAATVCVVPLRIARGIQNKVLEAMAASRAVVTLPEVAAGLGTISGQHLVVATDARQFADAVEQIIRDEQWRSSLGQHARRYVEEQHDWKPLLERLTRLIESVAARAATRNSSEIARLRRSGV